MKKAILLMAFILPISAFAESAKKCNSKPLDASAVSEEEIAEAKCKIALDCYDKKKEEVKKAWFPDLDTEIYKYHLTVRETCGVVFVDPRESKKHINDSSLPKEVTETKPKSQKKVSTSKQ